MPEDYDCFDRPARTHRHPRDRENDRLRAALKALDAQAIATTEPNYVAVPASLLADAVRDLEQSVTEAK